MDIKTISTVKRNEIKIFPWLQFRSGFIFQLLIILYQKYDCRECSMLKKSHSLTQTDMGANLMDLSPFSEE